MSRLSKLGIGAALLLLPLQVFSADPGPAPSAAQDESIRERDHPYFDIADLGKAQEVARRMHWPLAWIDGQLSALNHADAEENSEDEITQMAVKHLRSRAVIIFFDAGADMSLLSPVVRDQQLFQMDDGALPNGHHFYVPKIAFTDVDVTKALGRVSYTQMAATRLAAIDAVLTSIGSDGASGYKIDVSDPGRDLFPGGKIAVTLASFTTPPTTGIQFDETTTEMSENWLSKDLVIVALDGIKVDNTQQYAAMRDATESPSMVFIAWDGKKYHELKARQPTRRFGSRIHDFKP